MFPLEIGRIVKLNIHLKFEFFFKEYMKSNELEAETLKIKTNRLSFKNNYSSVPRQCNG